MPTDTPPTGAEMPLQPPLQQDAGQAAGGTTEEAASTATTTSSSSTTEPPPAEAGGGSGVAAEGEGGGGVPDTCKVPPYSTGAALPTPHTSSAGGGRAVGVASELRVGCEVRVPRCDALIRSMRCFSNEEVVKVLGKVGVVSRLLPSSAVVDYGTASFPYDYSVFPPGVTRRCYEGCPLSESRNTPFICTSCNSAYPSSAPHKLCETHAFHICQYCCGNPHPLSPGCYVIKGPTFSLSDTALEPSSATAVAYVWSASPLVLQWVRGVGFSNRGILRSKAGSDGGNPEPDALDDFESFLGEMAAAGGCGGGGGGGVDNNPPSTSPGTAVGGATKPLKREQDPNPTPPSSDNPAEKDGTASASAPASTLHSPPEEAEPAPPEGNPSPESPGCVEEQLSPNPGLKASALGDVGLREGASSVTSESDPVSQNGSSAGGGGG